MGISGTAKIQVLSIDMLWLVMTGDRPLRDSVTTFNKGLKTPVVN